MGLELGVDDRVIHHQDLIRSPRRRWNKYLVIPLVTILLAACGSARRTVPGGQSADRPAPTQTGAPQAVVTPTTSASTGKISLRIPMSSSKGYKGTLRIESTLPTVTLGDPGKVAVSGLPITSAIVTD